MASSPRKITPTKAFPGKRISFNCLPATGDSLVIATSIDSAFPPSKVEIDKTPSPLRTKRKI